MPVPARPLLPPGAPPCSAVPFAPSAVAAALARRVDDHPVVASNSAGAEVSTASAAADPGGMPPAVAKQLATNPVTPGDFTRARLRPVPGARAVEDGHLAQASPFLAVGIYISGDSRGCRNQPNLTATWVSTQLSKGWRLLPITLGPQAYCQPALPALRQRPGDQRAS